MKSVTHKIWKILEEMRNLFLWLAFKPYFAELIFAISGKNHKNKSSNNLFRNNLWSQ